MSAFVAVCLQLREEMTRTLATAPLTREGTAACHVAAGRYEAACQLLTRDELGELLVVVCPRGGSVSA